MRIPTDITPLEYIAGSGSQYIETAIHLLSTDVVKSKWRFQNSAGNVYGCFTSSGASDNFCLYAGSASTNAYIRYDGQVVRDFKAISGTVYEIEHGPDGFFANGSKEADFDAASFTCSAPMYIFMLPNSSSAKVTARCYGLQVIRGGEVAYDFIPARNEATGEVGMWEAVHGAWYGNDGTGAFTAGSAVARVLGTTHDGWRRRLMMGIISTPSPYDAIVEYVDGNGTFVDTLFTLGDHRIVAEMQMSLGYKDNAAMLGAWNNYGGTKILMIALYSNRFYFGVNNAELNVFPAHPFDTAWHTYDISARGVFKVDTDTLYNTPAAANPANTTAYIFARHAIRGTGQPGSPTTFPAGLRCRSFKIYDNTNDALVFDGIPVRIGTAGYIYDQISRQVFGGANGIDLVPGNDI